MQEVDKYQKLWNHKAYRNVAPGEQTADLFLELAKPKQNDTVTDYGCGTGRGALKISERAKVRMFDFAENCLDFNVRKALNERLTFAVQDLTTPVPGFTKFGYCTDVLEHIPPEDIDAVIRNVLLHSRHCFFQISCVPDVMGELIGEQLHLTVEPYSWWLEKFRSFGCNIHYSYDGGDFCIFYLTAFVTAKDIKAHCTVNTEDQVLIEQIKHNIQLGLTEIVPQPEQPGELIILAGGPSLNEFTDEIRLNKIMGVPIVTVNGAYNWALEHGIKPDAQIVLDAREFNKRFVEPNVESCKFLLASQCHPELVKAVPPGQAFLWHSGQENVQDAMKAVYGDEQHDYFPVFGGMTVMLRAFPLLIMMGYRKFVVYGFDSCLMDEQHHGYRQPENDYTATVDVECGGRTFTCHAWHVTQAQEFVELQQMIADLCEMDVKGDGLIAHIIKTGAELARQEAVV